MKKLFDFQKFKFYLWVGLAFLIINVFAHMSSHPGKFEKGLLNNIWAISYLTILNYLLFEYAMPRLGWRRIFTIFTSLLMLVAFIFLYSVGSYMWRCIGIALNIYTEFITYPSAAKGAADRMAYSMESLIFFAIIRHGYHYVKLKQATQQLRIEKQQAELNYLRSQTNPHFLFNTLNNIYSLARDKSDLAPESVLRLSKILRFMLYETGGAYIAIEQELKIIDDYIALEKLRYDDSFRINFNYDIEDMKQALPPLILIPLVENAFKHGVSETRGRPFIDIHLSVNKRQLLFVVKNSSEELPVEGKVKENIGLSNLRRQLELLYKEYNLSIQQGDWVFTATLKINLSSHV